MVIKYGADIQREAIIKNIDRITNQVFKLLPCREEGGDWETPLSNLLIELSGMSQLISDQTDLFSLLCKLEALQKLTAEDDFFMFRKIIFECLASCNSIKECIV